MPKLDFYDRGPNRPWVNTRLTTAAIVGHTTETSVRLWVRVWEPGEYCAFLSDTPIPTETALVLKEGAAGDPVFGLSFPDGSVRPLPPLASRQPIDFDTDLTAVFDFKGLKPGTTYFYAVFAARPNPWELGPDPARRKVCTQRLNPERLSFGLFSCHMPYKKNGDIENLQMWDNLRQELEHYRSDFIIACGDQVYVDGHKRLSIWEWLKKVKGQIVELSKEEQTRIMVSWYRDIYRGYWGFPQVRRLFERFPMYMMWDDHEIVDGWGSYKRKELGGKLDRLFECHDPDQNLALAYLMYAAAQQVYHEYEHSHNPCTPKGTWDYEFRWGPCPFYVLDMRGQRDFNRKTNDRILGKDQMSRLLAWLSRDDVRRARVVFIVSPVPIVHVCRFIVNHLDLAFLGIADDLRDEWEHESNWKERNRMLKAVFAQSQATGQRILFLSGDVHVAGAFRLMQPDAPEARVYQLTSSALTYSAPLGLEFVARESGELGGSDDPKRPYRFHLLQRVVTTNNFGIITADFADAENPEVTWLVHGNTRQPDEVTRLNALKIE